MRFGCWGTARNKNPISYGDGLTIAPGTEGVLTAYLPGDAIAIMFPGWAPGSNPCWFTYKDITREQFEEQFEIIEILSDDAP